MWNKIIKNGGVKMSKQLYSQRFILKIQSTKLKKANWSLNINLKTARQNNEIIQLGDSQLLRFIRDINNDNTTEEEIRSIKKEIKDLKKQKTNKKNIENIKNLYDKLDDALFIKDYVTEIEKYYYRVMEEMLDYLMNHNLKSILINLIKLY